MYCILSLPNIRPSVQDGLEHPVSFGDREFHFPHDWLKTKTEANAMPSISLSKPGFQAGVQNLVRLPDTVKTSHHKTRTSHTVFWGVETSGFGCSFHHRAEHHTIGINRDGSWFRIGRENSGTSRMCDNYAMIFAFSSLISYCMGSPPRYRTHSWSIALAWRWHSLPILPAICGVSRTFSIVHRGES